MITALGIYKLSSTLEEVTYDLLKKTIDLEKKIEDMQKQVIILNRKMNNAQNEQGGIINNKS